MSGSQGVCGRDDCGNGLAAPKRNAACIRSDTRLGIKEHTVATDFQKIFQMHDKLFVGVTGLATDVQTLWVAVAAPNPSNSRELTGASIAQTRTSRVSP